MHSVCQSLYIGVNPHTSLARKMCLHSQIRKMKLGEIKELLHDHKLSLLDSQVHVLH